MKKIKGVLSLFLFLAAGGCANVPNPFAVISAASGYTLTQNQLDATRNSYDGTFLASLKAYSAMPRCSPGTSFSLNNRCHDKTLLKKMRNADAAVDVAFDSTQDQITSGTSNGAVAAYTTLQTAVTAAKKILTDNNLIGF